MDVVKRCAAALWGAAAEHKRRRWDRAPALAQVHAGVPTLSVGGLEVGGSGKTPAAG
jgi:tetraacyldisaccharide-1-P 4'-kinase